MLKTYPIGAFPCLLRILSNYITCCYLFLQSVPKHQSDVIDLTDDAENAASKRVVETASINREMQRVSFKKNAIATLLKLYRYLV